MAAYRERLLNGLLALLVFNSVVLSTRVWFPPQHRDPQEGKEATVQAAPPAMDRRMPDAFRPESIAVRRGDGQIALLPVNTRPHAQVWFQVQQMLPALRVMPVSSQPERSDELPAGPAEPVSVTLWLPAVLKLSEWAERWNWNVFPLPGQSVRIDRVTILMGRAPIFLFAGPSGGGVRLSLPPDFDERGFLDIVRQLDGKLFERHRPLDAKALSVRTQAGLLVPDVRSVPSARVKVRKPEDTVEEVRYFPDPSVVRQIDERDAHSLTDGQRLLRLLSPGILEFRTAAGPGTAPDLTRALAAAQEWVSAHGGWPHDLLLGQYVQQPGKTRLSFEIRSSSGPYPVESAGGAFVFDLAADRVPYFRRYPEFAEMVFDKSYVNIIPPEDALRAAFEQVPLVFLEVQEMHIAYLLRPAGPGGEPAWSLEPSWVIRSGDTRIYVPAFATLQGRSPVVVP